MAPAASETARRPAVLWMAATAGAAAAVLTALIGQQLSRLGPWYWQLHKPRWQPPDYLFGPVWTLILALWGFALARVWYETSGTGRSWRLMALFGLNFLLNELWSALFFKLHRPDWALLEVLPLWLSVAALIYVGARLTRYAAWLIAPYLAWVSYAALLNLSIVRLNPVSG